MVVTEIRIVLPAFWQHAALGDADDELATVALGYEGPHGCARSARRALSFDAFAASMTASARRFEQHAQIDSMLNVESNVLQSRW